MILSWGDSEDLENVTRELRDLKELVGTFDNQANELQAELRLANEEFQDLVNVRGSTANQADKQNVVLQLRLEEMSKELHCATEVRRKNEMKILKLHKKVLLYKNELDCTLQKLEAEKQRYAMNATETKNTKDEQLQTSDAYGKLKMLSTKSPLNFSDVDVQLASHDQFAMDLVEIAFGLHEQLARCHMERKKQNYKHEHFVAELQKTFEFRLEALHRRHEAEMEKFRDQIEKAAKSTIVMLRTQRRQLMAKLMKANRDKEEANRTIKKLHYQLELLTSNLNSQQNNNENVC
ncbi:hypothetical protein EG68_01455 [Paragonimus skrjabini miyazakii]|uniref:Uncharacterized protein n=1 Tax=Paragonimus skrjabini miyazakii TaxID=59628 RepID=A0A8S9Z381_9TREM|nr:hypothetical protein EG68_01455 [Paragonimus skrjabini miyazakii]